MTVTFKEFLIEAGQDIDMQDFVSGYIEAALWSSTDDNDEPIDSNYDESDISPESMEQIRKDSNAFVQQNSKLLAQTPEDYDMVQAGRDFWFTRVGHGVGFWDRGLGEIGDQLSAAAQQFGDMNVFANPDDGQLYFE